MTKLKSWLIILALAVSAFTHFYRINQTYVFQNDEGRDALIAYRMIQTGKPVLLGPETSVGNMYLGPFYYYLMTPSLWIAGLDPVGPAVMVGLLAVVTTFLIILLGKKYGSQSAGIAAALFYALSPVMVHYSRSSWNPNVIPFFTACLLLVYGGRKVWHHLVFGILTGIIFQLHYVALIIPGLLLLLDIYQRFKSHNWNHVLSQFFYLLLGFILSTVPFWLFEIRHSFVNSQAFMTYLIEKSRGNEVAYPPYLSRLATNLKLLTLGMVGSSSLISSPLSIIAVLLISLVLLLSIFVNPVLLTTLTLFSILIVSVLKENIHIHYLAFLFPIISLIIGFCLTSKHLLLKILTALTLLFLASSFTASLKYNLFELESSQPRRARETAEYINKEAQGRAYNVVNSQGSYTTTISYYLAKSPNPPKSNLENLIYDICIGGPCPISEETTVLLFLTGPSHPSISEYVGHPQLNEFNGKRKIIKNEWVTYDIWVATILLEP